MSDVPIPSDVLTEILRRLPLEAVCRFRSVCKSWRGTIDDPAFLKLHHPHRPSDDCNNLLIKSKKGKLYTLSIDSLAFSDITEITVTNIKTLVRGGCPRICDCPVASCHGLVFVPSPKQTTMAGLLWNPFTGESVELPLCDGLTSAMSSGLAYDCANNDYKVVNIALCRKDHKLETFIYSLNSNVWRRVVDPAVRSRVERLGNVLGDEPACFAFGALHWVVRRFSYKKYEGAVRCVLAFDVRTETYRDLPPIPVQITHGLACSILGACGESLYLTCSSILYEAKDYPRYSANHFDVWMIDDYSSDESMWIKKWSLRFPHRFSFCFKLIAYLEKKGLILFQEGPQEADPYSFDPVPRNYEEKFLLYNVKNKSAKTVTIKGGVLGTSQVFPPSLLRLRKSGSAEDKSVDPERPSKKRKKTANDRLKLNLETVDLPGSYEFIYPEGSR